MAGITPNNKSEERSKNFDPKFPGALDSRNVVSGRLALDTELPLTQRYEGLNIYLVDEARSFIFTGGINDSNLEKISLLKSFNVDAPVDLSATNKYTFNHNLNTVDVIVNVFISGVVEPFKLELLPEVDENYLNSFVLDFAEWKTATGLTELPANTKILINY